MDNKVKIKVKVNSYKFINFLIYNKIKYDNLVQAKDSFFLDISYSDIDRFKRYETEIVKYYGIKGIVNFIIYNKYVLFGMTFGIIILLLLCNTIFSVSIDTDNIELKSKIETSLNENNIIKYKRKKSFEELQNIKNKILEDNKESLEWIEIIEDGCNYTIEVTERIIGKDDEIDNTPSNVVAERDGLIKFISLVNGVKIKDVNDYVKKGEVIISGDIYKGDKLISRVNARGIVYAEVWYTTTVTIPFKYTEYVETGEKINRYYLEIFDNEMTITGKYNGDNVMKEKQLILDKPYLPFDIYREKISLYEYKTFNVTEKEAYDEALIRADANLKRTLSDDEYILHKKVLKKEVFSSKMVLEVFYKVYENITNISRIEEVSNDS